MSQAKRKLLFEPVVSGDQAPRRKIRFKPDENSLVNLRASLLGVGRARLKDYVGLVLDESKGGCKVAFPDTVDLVEGTPVWVKVGKLPELRAEIRWRKKVGSSLCEIGLRYLE